MSNQRIQPASSDAPLTAAVSGHLRAALTEVLPTLPPFALAVLEAMHRAPQHTLSAGQIRRQLAAPHVVTVNGAVSTVAFAVLGAMGLPPDEAARIFPRPWRVLAVEGPAGMVKGFPWQLRQEVVDALDNMDARALALDRVQADEFAAQAPLTEGGRTTTSGEHGRRAAGAREACLAAYDPPLCQVCGIDFARAYGPAFADCLHVHHLNPMRLATEAREVNPAVDLVPVCPNCHAVIHAGGGVRTIDEVRALLLAGQPDLTHFGARQPA